MTLVLLEYLVAEHLRLFLLVGVYLPLTFYKSSLKGCYIFVVWVAGASVDNVWKSYVGFSFSEQEGTVFWKAR